MPSAARSEIIGVDGSCGPYREKAQVARSSTQRFARKTLQHPRGEAYIDWIRRFILFHGKRHPNEMGEQKISAFLTHLAVDRNVAASTQNQAFCALSRRWRYGTGPWPTVTMMVSTIFGFARHRSHPHTGGGRRQDHEGKIASSHHRRWTVCADSTLKDLTNR